MKKTKFKQTEIGEIPQEWNIKSLHELAEIISGGTPKTTAPEYWNGKIPWLSIVDFNQDQKKVYNSGKYITEAGLQNSSTNILEKGMLIISARGTVGALAQLGRDMAFNQSCYGLNAKGEIKTNDFLYYALKSRTDSIKQKTHGSVFSTITKEVLENIFLPIPSLEEQDVIASILSSVDDKIELNRKMNKTLEEMGKALFKQWFVDFEFPDKNGKPYKSSGGEMVDSDLGMIPESWKVVPLVKMFDFLEGPGIRNWQYSDTGTRFINIRLINDGDIEVKSANLINQHDVETKYQHFFLREGDMVVSTSGTLGRAAIVRKSHLPLLLNTSVIRFRPKDNVSYPFMYQYLQSEEFLSEQIRLSAGSVQANFGPTHLKQMAILIPNQEVLDQFNQICRFSYQRIIGNMGENEQLNFIRDSLLPRLMSGRIRVNS